jgi:ferredoxin
MTEPTWDGDLAPLVRWVANEAPVPEIELACADHGDPAVGPRREMVVVVPGCVAAVPAVCYLELAAAGAERVIVGCSGPQIDYARRLLEAVDGACVLEASPPPGGKPRSVYNLHELPVSRRRLFARSSSRRQEDAPRTTRTRAIAALQALRRGPTPGLATIAAGAAVLEANGCTACGVCVRACPVGALSLDSNGREAVLAVTVAACADCGRCVDLCPPHALTRRGAASWAALLAEREPHPLARIGTRHCVRCGAAFPASGSGELCDVCAFRRNNPFGSRLIHQDTLR